MNDALWKKAPIARELLKAIRGSFEQIEDPRRCPGSIALVDALMSAIAMYALKFPSLLKFDEQRNEAVIRANLGVTSRPRQYHQAAMGRGHAPCSTSLACG